MNKTFIALCALSFVFWSSLVDAAAVTGVPKNDDAFYLEIQIDGFSTDIPSISAGLPNTTSSSRGVLVVDGKVVEQEFQASLGSSESYCLRMGIRCEQKKSISGTYQNGHLDVTVKNDITRTYDGQPLGGQGDPVVPGSTVRSTEDHFTGDLDDPNILRFNGKLTHTFVGEGVECAKWRDGFGGICDLDRYFEKPPEVRKYDWTGFVRAPADGVTVVSKTREEVEKRLAGEKEFAPLKAGDIIKVGDTVSTGFNSSVWLNTGFGSIIVQSVTQLRLDTFELNALRRSGRAYLLAGNVGAIIQQPASIRSDFSISTPSGANASIRGSEMQVEYDAETKVTTVLVYEDKAYVKGIAGQNEVEVLAGEKVTIDKDGTVSSQTNLTGEDRAGRPDVVGDSKTKNWWWIAGGALALVALAFLGFAGVVRKGKA